LPFIFSKDKPNLHLLVRLGGFIEIIVSCLQTHPLFTTVLTTIGGLRLVIKPTMSMLHYLADQTDTRKDNDLLDEIESSKVIKGIAYGLDWLTSIQIGK
jgi:hypothetical protein